LDTIDAVHAIDEEDQDEYEGDPQSVLHLGDDRVLRDEAVESTVSARDVLGSVCVLERRTHVNIFRRIEKGNGLIRSMNSTISATRSRKTWCHWHQLTILTMRTALGV
jgi:hypothetical protein